MKSRAIGSYLQTGAGRPGQKIPAYGGGRVCAAPHCNTVLSTYNPALYCSLHDIIARPNRRFVPRGVVR